MNQITQLEDAVRTAEAEVLRAARWAAATQDLHDLANEEGRFDDSDDYRRSLARMFNARTEMMLAAKALRRADLAVARCPAATDAAEPDYADWYAEYEADLLARALGTGSDAPVSAGVSTSAALARLPGQEAIS